MSRPYSYATTADVQALLPGLFSTPSALPGATQVAAQIEHVANELDSVMTMLAVTTPVPTGATASFQMARSWNAIGAAYRAALSMPQGSGSKHAEAFGAEWKAILTGIESGHRGMPDEPTPRSKLPRVGAPSTEKPIYTRANAAELR